MMISVALLLLLQAEPPKPGLVGAALGYLARHQAENGSWGRRPAACTCPPDPGPAVEEVEATSVAVLALLGAGYTPASTGKLDGLPAGAVVEKGLLWMLGRQRPDGSYGGGSAAVEGLAALAISEAFSTFQKPLYGAPAQKAIAFAAAHPATDARGLLFEGMAFKSAQIAGLDVPKGADVKVLEALAARRGDEPSSIFILSSIQLLKIFTLRSKQQLDLSGIPGTDPSRMEMETVYAVTLALFQVDGPEGPAWQAWARRLKGWSVPSQIGAAAACERGSWDLPGTRPRLTSAALGALSHEFYYATANVWPK